LQSGNLPVTPNPFRPELRWAIEAAQSKMAAGVTLLDLSGLGAFTGAFLLCTGFSSRQVQAIADEIEQELSRHGREPLHREGYNTGEWVLLDYGAFVVHIFGERARLYYDLERLWRSARRTDLPDVDAAGAAGA
jgi:ribosome-associated protein